MSVTINGTNGLTFSDASVQNTAATGFGFKNRIINGDMRINQRGTGAQVPLAAGVFLADRWVFNSNKSTTFNAVAATASPPAGFTSYLSYTSTGAYSLTAGDFQACSQYIEGFNVADLSWGTANAKAITISFWVKCSLTGTFGGSVANNGVTRSYPFTYTINSANTWEYKTVTIAGDTSGTWTTDNSAGLRLNFSLGTGTTYSGTAGAWASANYNSATGAVNVSGTNGATFYITGVQLEKGSTATSFDYRPYGTELALCQRYYEVFGDGLAAGTVCYIGGYSASPGGSCGTWHFKAQKRAIPTISLYSGSSTPNGSSQTSKDMYNLFNGTAPSYAQLAAGSTASAEL